MLELRREETAVIDERILGTWRLRRTQAVDDAGHPLPPPYSETPSGVAVFDANGRMFALLTDGRGELPPGETRPFLAYTGRYTFDGTTLLTYPDATSERERLGTEQVRTVRFEAGGMTLVPPRRAFGGVMQHQELFWERVGNK